MIVLDAAALVDVVLAEERDAALVTTDRRLSGAGLAVEVRVPGA